MFYPADLQRLEIVSAIVNFSQLALMSVPSKNRSLIPTRLIYFGMEQGNRQWGGRGLENILSHGYPTDRYNGSIALMQYHFPDTTLAFAITLHRFLVV